MPDYLVFGRDAFVGAAEEVTYGTAVSPRTHFARIRSCGIHRKVEKAGVGCIWRRGAAIRTNFPISNLGAC